MGAEGENNQNRKHKEKKNHKKFYYENYVIFQYFISHVYF